MISTARIIGIMLISNINDHCVVGVEDQGCCPDCCAPCGVTRDLFEHDEGQFNFLLRAGVREIGGGWSWWNDEEGTVDADWLRSRWKCQTHPVCEEDERGQEG